MNTNSHNEMRASHQWSHRPADERFWTVAAMTEACRKYAIASQEVQIPLASLKVEASPTGEILLSKGEGFASPTFHAFGQLSGLAGAPSDYLRTLPAPLAASLVRHGLSERTDTGTFLVQRNGGSTVRAVTSEKYSRLWNFQVGEALAPLIDQGWRVPPARPAMPSQPGTRPATKNDILTGGGGGGLSVREGDLIAPAGVYASDRDMFAFLINETPIEVDGHCYSRAIMAENGEIGDKSFRLSCFTYDHVCGNHIVWGAKLLAEVRLVHRGREGAVERRALDGMRRIEGYGRMDADWEVSRIRAAKRMVIGKSQDQTVEALFNRRIAAKAVLNEAWESAEAHAQVDGADPNTVWGMVSGMTRIAQVGGYADKRVQVDRDASKIMALAL